MAVIRNWGRPSKGRKLPLKRIPAALEAHERAQAASDELRVRIGWDPVPENSVIRAWRARLAEGDVKRASVKRATQRATVSELGDLRRRRDAYVRRIESEIACLVGDLREAKVPMREIADQLGMTREGVYQFTRRVTA